MDLTDTWAGMRGEGCDSFIAVDSTVAGQRSSLFYLD